MIEMVAGVNRFLFVHFRPLYMVIFNFGKAIMKGHCKFWIFQSPPGVMAISSFVALLLVCAYLLLPPIFQPVIHNIEIPKTNGSIKLCNVFEGSWIQDESYPLYNSSLCPFAERGFNCLANGRRDQGYIKWRWRPKNCDIPKFDVHQVLEKLRGKRIVFVGDSLGRSQWESLICMLMTGVEDKKSVYEVNRNKITKQIRFLGVRFGSFDLRVDFYRSVFLVQPSSVSWRAPKRVKSTLKLDKLDGISKEWINSDVLIFNSGHWWTPSKLFELGRYFSVNGSLKLGMPITTGFRTALNTWASWADTNINPNRTSVFFRTFESSHWRDRSPISDIIIRAMKEMSVPVTVLHVTPMVAFRSDAHVGVWSDNPSVPDCSHWCLPGVPDMWNEILLSHLL